MNDVAVFWTTLLANILSVNWPRTVWLIIFAGSLTALLVLIVVAVAGAHMRGKQPDVE